MLLPRIWFTFRIAYQHDRSTILEESFYSEASKTKKVDKDAFVLFEPKNNGDVYVSIRPFAGMRMITTRHLVLQKVLYPQENRQNFLSQYRVKRLLSGLELISKDDFTHLWMLSARDVQAKSSLLFGKYYTYKWKAKRLIDISEPELLLFGDNYEIFYNAHHRSGKIGTYSYIRSGATALFIPLGQKSYLVEVEASSVREEDRAKLYNSLFEAYNPSNFNLPGEMIVEEDAIKIQYHIFGDNKPKLILLFNSKLEYWINVHVNGVELPIKSSS